jgi:hypothetical protein
MTVTAVDSASTGAIRAPRRSRRVRGGDAPTEARMAMAISLFGLWLFAAPVAWAQDAPPPEPPSSDLSRELRTVEEDVDDLKERVFRSKATLQLLRELVSSSATVGARVAVWHVNDIGGGYSMESAQYFLNGKNIFSKVDQTGALDDIDELKIHEQALPAGNHDLVVNLGLRGAGYRIFSYLKGYEFRVSSTYSFKVEDGLLTVVRAVATSKGAFKSYEERPRIDFESRAEDLRDR